MTAPRNVNRCTPCLEGAHARCTGSAGNVGCGCIHAAPAPQHLVLDPDEVATHTFAPPRPPTLVVAGEDGTPLVTLDPRPGGTIVVHEEDRLDEAARRFVDGVRQLLGVAPGDRDALLDLLGAVEAADRPHPGATREAAKRRADEALGALRDAVARARRHLNRTGGSTP